MLEQRKLYKIKIFEFAKANFSKNPNDLKNAIRVVDNDTFGKFYNNA